MVSVRESVSAPVPSGLVSVEERWALALQQPPGAAWEMEWGVGLVRGRELAWVAIASEWVQLR